MMVRQGLERAARYARDRAADQLLEDDAVDLARGVRIGNGDRDAMRLDPVAIEGVGHREAGADQAGPLDAILDELGRGHVADVDDRDADLASDAFVELVRGVAAQDEAFGARLLQPPGGGGQDVARAVPVAAV
jgi:hypothetical protein